VITHTHLLTVVEYLSLVVEINNFVWLCCTQSAPNHIQSKLNCLVMDLASLILPYYSKETKMVILGHYSPTKQKYCIQIVFLWPTQIRNFSTHCYGLRIIIDFLLEKHRIRSFIIILHCISFITFLRSLPLPKPGP
jgi:hypothetical protein